MGRFFVIEGLDGAGTTTQAARLVARLGRDRPTLATNEPTDRAVGRLIRRTLAADPDAPAPSVLPWLFAADRADHLRQVIEPWLARGHVVSDRYYHSSLAYQSLTMPLEEVHALNHTFRTPDLTIFVDVPVQVALDRIHGRGAAREIYEHGDHLTAIYAAYQRVLDFLDARGEPLFRVDGTGSPDHIEDAIWTRIADFL